MQATTSAIDYQTLFSALPGMSLILSPEFIILDATDAYLRVTLTQREDIIGKHIFEVFPDNPDAPEAMATANLEKSLKIVCERLMAHTMPVQRYDILRPQSIGGGFEERYWLFSNCPVLHPQGELRYIVCQAIDVTMQQMAHHQIQSNRERVEILAQATSDVIWDMDLLNNCIWWSDSLKDIFGYDPHELAFTVDWAREVHPEDKARVVTGISEITERGGNLWTESYRLRRKNGGYATVLERGYILRDEKGIAYRMLGSMFDITEQLTVEQKLKNSDSRFRKLLDLLPNLAWFSEPGYEPGNGVRYLNKAWYNYTGLPEDLLGGGEKVIHPDDLPLVNELWVKSVKNNKTYEQEIRIKNIDTGVYRWFLSRAVPIANESGKNSIWLGICTDIEDQKKAEKQYQELIEMLQKKEDKLNL